VKLEARHKITGSYEQSGQYHFPMDTISCICVPKEDGLDIHTSNQWISLFQAAVAEALDVPSSYINVTVRRLGGGFGLKITRANQCAAACSIAAFKLNRPVRFVLTLEECMATTGKRHPAVNDYEITVDEDGLIKKLSNSILEDGGCVLNEKGSEQAMLYNGSCYDDRAWSVKASEVQTDSAANTFCRSPGTVEMIAQIENMMEHIAHVVEREPLDVRLRNIPRNSPMRTMLQDFSKSVGNLLFNSW
jgi:xanthine dehydrogenase/oxidase